VSGPLGIRGFIPGRRFAHAFVEDKEFPDAAGHAAFVKPNLMGDLFQLSKIAFG
jgi:hypothetical protein